jgi:4-amino-4-deoxy-L-arabinose transferase-like glycosyltransferase
MMLTKPQGAYVVPLLFGLVAVLAWRRVWISLLSAVIVLAAVWSIHVVEKKAFAGSEAAKGSFSIWRRTANVPQEG